MALTIKTLRAIPEAVAKAVKPSDEGWIEMDPSGIIITIRRPGVRTSATTVAWAELDAHASPADLAASVAKGMTKALDSEKAGR